MSLDVKEVIETARQRFQELLPEYAQYPPRLEELEREGPKDAYWAVTFSVPKPTGSEIVGGNGPFGYNRVAKTIVIAGESGRFIALRQRAA